MSTPLPQRIKALHIPDTGLDFAVVDMTPELAQEILDRPHINRRVNTHRLARWTRVMSAGLWMLGPSIMLDDDGALVDGEHRLTAVIRTGITVRMVVEIGVSRAAFPHLDNGLPRSTATALALSNGGQYTNAGMVAAALKMLKVYALKSAEPSRGWAMCCTIGRLEAWQTLLWNEKYPGVGDWAVAARRVAEACPIVSSHSAALTALYLGSLISPERTESFVHAVTEGVHLQPADGPLVLRNARPIAGVPHNGEAGQAVTLAVTGHALRAWLDRKPVTAQFTTRAVRERCPDLGVIDIPPDDMVRLPDITPAAE